MIRRTGHHAAPSPSVARRTVLLIAGLLLWLALLPVAIPTVASRAAAATPPFTAPSSWAATCDHMRPAGARLQAGANCRWLRLDGVYRRYVVVVPARIAADPTAGWPLVLMLHGLRGTGERMMQITDWIEVGARAGVITVFPTSWRYRFLNGEAATSWMSEDMWTRIDTTIRLGGYPSDRSFPARDPQFLRRIVADVQGRIAIDPQRIHVSGSSNGGNFVARVAVELGDLVASASCAGYCDPPPESAWPSITRPVPVLFGLGTRNEAILRRLAEVVDPDPIAIPLAWKAARPLVWGFVAGYLDAWNLERAPTGVTERATTTTVSWRTTRPDAPAGGIYRLVLLRGAHHPYPTWRNNPKGHSMAAISWAFFRSHRMPAEP